MNDIKSLYLAAKASGKANDISAYTEAIHELLESNPGGYISNLEYIISSDIGLQTLPHFVEKNGLPISCHGEITSILEKCIEKCKTFKKDDTSFKEALVTMESFRKKYIGCFMMESYFSDQLPENYVSVYYGKNSKGISNRKLMAGMLEKFGEAAIPDILITADSISHNSLKTAIQFIESNQRYGNPVICEWVLEAVKNIFPDLGAELIALESKSMGRIVYEAKNRNHQLYREAVITGNDEVMVEYSETEINALSDFIAFNEYKLTWADELGLSPSNIQQDIYSLYEEYEGLIDSDCELMTESTKEEKIAATKIVKNMKALSKRIRSMIKPAIRDAVKKDNSGSPILSVKVQYPAISIVFRDRNKKDKILVKNLIKKNLDSIIDSDSEFVNCVELGVRVEIQSFTKNHDNKSFKIYQSAVHDALKPLIDEGIISFKKTNNMYYYVEMKYMIIPVYMSRDYLMSGVDNVSFESVSSFDEFVADSVIPMLPTVSGTEPIEEAQWLLNTRNKKTGDIPGYIKRNHKLDYGEDPSPPGSSDIFDKSDKSSEVQSEPVLDDFKRPSAEDMSQSYSGLDDEPEKTPETTAPMTQAERNAINNYYYYTYNNSHNRNSGSFNRDNSHHDDHSTTTKKTVDDHSYGKRISSDDNITKDNIADDEPEVESHTEAVGDADDNRPESDHPVKDIMTDIDRNLTKKQQSAKKVVQNVQNAGKAFVKPAVRTQQWIANMVGNWKDADENNIKERMADPHARSRLFSVIKTAITGGSLLKAGLLLNPIFLFLTATRGIGKNKREFRIRNEMIGELKTELEVIDEKIKDADRVGDNQAKYKLMRFKNELNKKLLRVGGSKGWSKII